MFSPVETQVIFLSKETPIVSVGLRTAGNKTVRHQDISAPVEKDNSSERVNSFCSTSDTRSSILIRHKHHLIIQIKHQPNKTGVKMNLMKA